MHVTKEQIFGEKFIMISGFSPGDKMTIENKFTVVSFSSQKIALSTEKKNLEFMHQIFPCFKIANYLITL